MAEVSRGWLRNPVSDRQAIAFGVLSPVLQHYLSVGLRTGASAGVRLLRDRD
ncbi:MAG: hypothetical protein EBE86_029875 [Hormoscilla sp. GUM202]|nr:hypothetical protein [Hormoscilla sp. GUM202]